MSSARRQTSFKFPTRGGKRKGAGRPRTRPHPGLVGPGVPHLKRPDFAARHPVHMTMRAAARSGVSAHVPAREDRRGRAPGGAQRVRRADHPLLDPGQPPAPDRRGGNQPALSRGLQGLATRLARRSQQAPQAGAATVFADRYHAHPPEDAARGQARRPLCAHQLPSPRARAPATGLDGPAGLFAVHTEASRRGRSCGCALGLAAASRVAI